MRVPRRFLMVASLAAVALVLGQCSKESKPTAPSASFGPGDLAPDFALQDVNPGSATSGANVSPRQYLGRVSCWFFGFAT